jgi:hypothetical protein
MHDYHSRIVDERFETGGFKKSPWAIPLALTSTRTYTLWTPQQPSLDLRGNIPIRIIDRIVHDLKSWTRFSRSRRLLGF